MVSRDIDRSYVGDSFSHVGGAFFLSFFFFFRPRSFCSVLVHVCLDRRTDEEYRIKRWTWGSFVLYIITLYHSCFRIFSIESNKTIIHITKNSIELQEKVMNQGKSVLTQMKGRKHSAIKDQLSCLQSRTGQTRKIPTRTFHKDSCGGARLVQTRKMGEKKCEVLVQILGCMRRTKGLRKKKTPDDLLRVIVNTSHCRHVKLSCPCSSRYCKNSIRHAT